MAKWLPMFPLGKPLFPRLRLDIQVFEQRYSKLVRACLRENTGFGICGIRRGSEVGVMPQIFDSGVEVKIIDWNQLQNGLLSITVEAERRFHVGKKDVDPDGLLSAEISYFDDEIDEEIPAWASGLTEIYQELMLHPEVSKRLPDLDQIQSSELGFGLAQILPMADDFRMQCFDTLLPAVRLELLAEHIQRLANST